ncbi:MAG: efflux RND transporter periplasmic adaptor subunit [Clostridiales bacterium]|nr:efflux RND transporter periplasmic adaptor subunit [Clostridiales bacterium]
MKEDVKPSKASKADREKAREAKAAKVLAAKQEKEKKARRRRRRIRRLIIFLLILAVLATAGYFIIQKLKSQYTVNYQAYTVTTGTISNSLSFNGTLQAINNTTYSAASDATVRMLYVKKGDEVKQGDMLLRYSTGKTVTADFDGTVNQLLISEGVEVKEGDELIQLVDFEHMKVSIRVDEYDISDVKIGDECRITATATEDTFTSTIADINYTSSSSGSVAYYTATAYVDVKGGVYPGMQVTVTIPQDEASNVVILKEDALSFDRTNQAFVYMLGEDGSLQPVYVKTGVSNGNYVEIKQGLVSGDTVYAEVAATESSSGGLLSSLFGGTNIMGGSRQGQGSSRSSQSGQRSSGGFSGGGNWSGSFPGGGR